MTSLKTNQYISIITAYVIVGIGIAIVYISNPNELPANTIDSDFEKFAAFFIIAQAIERLLEPITALFDEEKKEAKKEVDLTSKEAIQAAKHSIADIKVIVKNLTWGMASFIAMLFCCWIGLGLLNTIGIVNAPTELDIIVTGLAIGAGTQPLHDLIEQRIKKPSDTLTMSQEKSDSGSEATKTEMKGSL